jgi:hypothetical protein
MHGQNHIKRHIHIYSGGFHTQKKLRNEKGEGILLVSIFLGLWFFGFDVSSFVL